MLVKIRCFRNGMATVIVLVMVSILLVSVLSLMRSGREYRHQVIRSIRELQVQYMALGAIQHAELKVRLFPTELYDAAMYSLGKNPNFDFSEISAEERDALSPLRREEYASTEPYIRRANPYNPGPRFISDGVLSNDQVMKWYKLEALDAADTQVGPGSWFPEGWPKDENNMPVPNNDLYLWRFRYDITNLPAIQPVLNWNDHVVDNPSKLDISSSDRFPYKAVYEVVSLKVLSIAGQRRFNQEAVKLIAEASISDPQTGLSYDHRLEKIIKVSRR